MAFLDILKKSSTDKKRIKSSSFAHSHSYGYSTVTQFFIKIDEPHRIWKPDEYISGETTLEIRKDVTNIAVELSLISEIKVKVKNTSPTTRTKRVERLIERSTFLYGNNDIDSNKIGSSPVNGLTKGQHKFPFRIKIPHGKKIFSSIKFEKGSIDYFLKCSFVTIGTKQNDKPIATCEQGFTVIVPLDVSKLPQPRTKRVVLQSYSMLSAVNSSTSNSANKHLSGEGVSSSFTKFTRQSATSRNSKISKSSSGSSSSTNNGTPVAQDKTVSISVDLPQSGFVVGELIPIQISVKHYKEFHHPAGLIVTLVRICRVGNKDEAMETFRKDICQTILPLYIDPQMLESHSTAFLKVPLDTFSTFTSFNNFFSFQYYVEVMVNLSRKNIIYTESNRIIGGGDEGYSQNSDNLDVSNKVTTGMEDNLNNIHRKVLKLVSTSHVSTDQKETMESNIVYQDMVNVEKLKRLRNVTGMSIEIIVGTTRLEEVEAAKESDDVERTQQSQTNIPYNEMNYVKRTPSPPRVGQLPTPNMNEWLSSSIDYQQVPEYTPNENMTVSEDKQEFEKERLLAMESEPEEY